jgi:hypothetical protein
METRIRTTACALLLSCLACSSASGTGGWSNDPGAAGGSSAGAGSTSSGAGADASPGTGSSSGVGVTPGGSSSGSSKASSGATSSGTGPQDAAISDAQVEQTVTLTAQPFTVAAGAEVFKCQLFANPFGANADLIWMQGDMSPGSHHFFLFNIDPTSAVVYSKTLSDCPGAGLEFHPFPFLSQQPHWTVQFPTASDGSPMGYPLAAANYLMINVHYLNTTSAPIQATVSIQIKAAKPGVVKTHVGSVFLNQTTMSVPTTATMANPTDTTGIWGGNPLAASSDGSYTIFSSWSHMHQWGLEFLASTNNQTFYTESNWDSPGLFWHMPGLGQNPTTATGSTTPIHMTASQGITWTCKYYNDTGSPLGFGDSARSSVMCIYIGQYYPASPTTPDVIYVFN